MSGIALNIRPDTIGGEPIFLKGSPIRVCPYTDPASLLPPTVADDRFKILEKVIERLQALHHDTRLGIYYPQTVATEALPHLAQQFNVWGLRGWRLADTEQQRRDLIEAAIELNRRSGTPYAILTAMAKVGYPNTTIDENPPLYLNGWWQLDGEEQLAGLHLVAFVVYLDPVQSDVSVDKIELILGLIDEWKNARSALLDLRIGDISLLQNLLILDGTWLLNGYQEIDGEKDI